MVPKKSVSLTDLLSFKTDFDECDLNLDNCHADALCVNTRTHFECRCKSGFLGDGINCTGEDM